MPESVINQRRAVVLTKGLLVIAIVVSILCIIFVYKLVIAGCEISMKTLFLSGLFFICWGKEGHILNVRKAFELLPKSDKALLSKKNWEEVITKYSEWPDEYRASHREDISLPDSGENLHLGMEDAEEAAFYILQMFKAIEQDKSDEIALYAGCLAHVIGDLYCPGHGPKLLALSWLYGQIEGPNGLKYGRSQEDARLDIQYKNYPCYFEEGIKDYKPKLLACEPEELKKAAIIAAYQANAYALKVEKQAWVSCCLKKKKEKWEAILDTGIEATKSIADLWHTCFMIGTGKVKDCAIKIKTPTIQEALSKIKKPFNEYFVYEGVKKSEKLPAIGVLVDHPLTAKLSRVTAFHASWIIRELSKEGFRVDPVTVDKLVTSTTFNRHNYPLLIMHIMPINPNPFDPYYRTYRRKNDCIQAVEEYLKDGGVILYVGSHPFKRAKDYSKEYGAFICGPKLPQPQDQMEEKLGIITKRIDNGEPYQGFYFALASNDLFPRGIPQKIELNNKIHDPHCVNDAGGIISIMPIAKEITQQEFIPLVYVMKDGRKRGIVAAIKKYEKGYFVYFNWLVLNPYGWSNYKFSSQILTDTVNYLLNLIRFGGFK